MDVKLEDWCIPTILGSWPQKSMDHGQKKKYPLTILSTGISPGRPTINGNVYSKEAIATAIKLFNIRARHNGGVPGSIINREHIGQTGPITHLTKELFINDSGLLCARLKIVNKDLFDKICRGTKMAARPIITIPEYELDRKPMYVSNIINISRVHIEGETK